MTFLEIILEDILTKKPNHIYYYVNKRLNEIRDLMSVKFKVGKKEKEDFDKFHTKFIDSDIYSYLFRNGYQLVEQSEFLTLQNIIHKLTKGKNYIDKQIEAFMKSYYPEELESNP